MSWTITGPSGLLQWSYFTAATLGPWSISVVGGVRTLTAAIVSVDAFRASQQPLTFVVPRPKGHPSWRWPITALQIAGGSLSATLGPQE